MRGRAARKGFELRKRQLDGIEVRAVGRQKPEARADAFDGGLHLGLLVHGEVIEDDHITRPQRGDEHLLDVGEKRGIVDRAVKDGGRREAIHRSAAITVWVCQ